MDPGQAMYLAHLRHDRRRTDYSDAFPGGAWPGRAS